MTVVLKAQLIRVTVKLQFTVSFPSTWLFNFWFDRKDLYQLHSVSFADDICLSEKVRYLRRSSDIKRRSLVSSDLITFKTINQWTS